MFIAPGDEKLNKIACDQIIWTGGSIMNFAVIGGDMRQAKLAELLTEDGHRVNVFAVDKLKVEKVIRREKLSEAIADADCVILPLPATSSEGVINTPFSGTKLTARQVFSEVLPGQTVCAGRVDAGLRELAAQAGAKLYDYFAREELNVANAASTAEGAVQIIMEETPKTLSGAKCLVIGYGRIGKFLAHKLWAMGAKVTVAARKYSDFAWITALGYEREHSEKLDGKLSGYDAVINTVPARILDESRLKQLSKGCLCLDLASKPGGIDFQAASRLGVHAVWALSLPGEVAPESAGLCIRDTIYNILLEKEVE